MALTVPQQQVADIKAFLSLSEDKIEQFLAVLNDARPEFNIYDLSADIAKALELRLPLTSGITRVLASLHLTRDAEFRNISLAEFVDNNVLPALNAVHAFKTEEAEAQWKKLRRFLLGALALERSVGTTVKAGYVLTQHERIFNGARIMSDLRPIYHFDVTEKPDAAVIIHMLRITQRDSRGTQSDHYFALDSNDLIVMRDVVERAMKKEQTLRGIVKDSGVIVLNPKAI